MTANVMVLILVVMEDALAQEKPFTMEELCFCLNPCCNGRCTRTNNDKRYENDKQKS